MRIKVVTTQKCPVYGANPKKSAGGAGGHEIAANIPLEVDANFNPSLGITPITGDLVRVMAPENMYPFYLDTGRPAYIEPQHVRLLTPDLQGSKSIIRVVVYYSDGSLQEIP